MPKAFLLFMVVGVNNAPDSRELGFGLRRNRRVCVGIRAVRRLKLGRELSKLSLNGHGFE